MSRGKQLTSKEKEKIDKLKIQSLKTNEIARRIGRSPHVVRNYLTNPTLYGSKKPPGRLVTFSDIDKETVIKMAEDPKISCQKILREMNGKVPIRSIQRIVREYYPNRRGLIKSEDPEIKEEEPEVENEGRLIEKLTDFHVEGHENEQMYTVKYRGDWELDTKPATSISSVFIYQFWFRARTHLALVENRKTKGWSVSDGEKAQYDIYKEAMELRNQIDEEEGRGMEFGENEEDGQKYVQKVKERLETDHPDPFEIYLDAEGPSETPKRPNRKPLAIKSGLLAQKMEDDAPGPSTSGTVRMSPEDEDYYDCDDTF